MKTPIFCHLRHPDRLSGRFLQSAKDLLLGGWVAILTPLILWPSPASAQVNIDNLISDMRGQIANMLTIAMWVLAALCVLFGIYIVITGAVRIAQDKEGGVTRFAVGIVVVVIMLALAFFLVGQGTEQITQVRSGDLG